MLFDLHVPWRANDPELPLTLGFLEELGYNAVALSHTISGKLPADLTCAVPDPLPFEAPSKLRILRRCNLILSDPAQNHRLQTLSENYDILALRPTNEKALYNACSNLECDIISLDLTVRLDFILKMKILAQAVERGIKFEICYGPAVLAMDSNARRNVISNATQLIRALRGRGLIISSEASKAAACRGPWDVINLASVWGLGQEKGKEAISKNARHTVVSAQLRRTSYRGVVNVVYGGEKPAPKPIGHSSNGTNGTNKRKAEDEDTETAEGGTIAKPLSKREQKRRKKASLLETQSIEQEAHSTTTASNY